MNDIHRIAQVSVTVQDVERAKAFYRDVVGLRHLFDAPPGLCFFDCGGTRLMLSVAEGEGAGTSILYFDASDIVTAHARMRNAGARFLEAPHVIADLGDRLVWIAAFEDGEGNTMALMSEAPKA